MDARKEGGVGQRGAFVIAHQHLERHQAPELVVHRRGTFDQGVAGGKPRQRIVGEPNLRDADHRERQRREGGPGDRDGGACGKATETREQTAGQPAFPPLGAVPQGSDREQRGCEQEGEERGVHDSDRGEHAELRDRCERRRLKRKQTGDRREPGQGDRHSGVSKGRPDGALHIFAGVEVPEERHEKMQDAADPDSEDECGEDLGGGSHRRPGPGHRPHRGARRHTHHGDRDVHPGRAPEEQREQQHRDPERQEAEPDHVVAHRALKFDRHQRRADQVYHPALAMVVGEHGPCSGHDLCVLFGCDHRRARGVGSAGRNRRKRARLEDEERLGARLRNQQAAQHRVVEHPPSEGLDVGTGQEWELAFERSNHQSPALAPDQARRAL